MKLFNRISAAACAAALSVSMLSIADVSAHDYESLGVDASAKATFEKDVDATTQLPVVSITTKNNSEMILSKEEYTDCVVDVFGADEKYDLNEVSAGIKVRGNSSAYYGNVEQIKKNPVPYRIKFDKKQNMLGLNDGAKCKSWVLLKTDWNICANSVAFRMAREIFDDTAFVSDCEYVHLYVNDKLQGTYLLCEQSQVDKNRVDVTEPEKDYTGTDIGYYLELDNYATSDSDPYICMDYEGATVTDLRATERQFVPAEYSIKNDIYSIDQVDYIDKYLNNVFELIYRATEKNEFLALDKDNNLVPSNYKSAEEAICAVLDIESVVDMYLLYEIVHDYDCGEGSFYMCVDFSKDSKVPKLQFTSPWDFNWAYNDSTSRYWAGAFCEKSFAKQYGDRSNPWFILLAKQEWFRSLCTKKWIAESANVKAAVAEERAVLAQYKEDINKTQANGTDNAENTLRWVDDRLKWMDKAFSEHTHEYTSKVTKKPTCSAEGVTTYTCKCGIKYTEKIPATGEHKYTAEVVKPTYDAQGYTLHKCSECGKSYKDTYTKKLVRTSIAKVKVSSVKNKYYTGKAITQKPVVKLGSKTLIAGTDYTVSYKNNKAIGTATVTITGKGAYTGTVKTTFKIFPQKTTLKSAKSPKTRQLKVTYSKVANVTGYQVTYSTSSKFTKKTTKSVNVKGTSKTISKLTKGKTYYVKVRTYKTVGKTRFYSGYSAVKKVKVK